MPSSERFQTDAWKTEGRDSFKIGPSTSAPGSGPAAAAAAAAMTSATTATTTTLTVEDSPSKRATTHLEAKKLNNAGVGGSPSTNKTLESRKVPNTDKGLPASAFGYVKKHPTATVSVGAATGHLVLGLVCILIE